MTALGINNMLRAALTLLVVVAAQASVAAAMPDLHARAAAPQSYCSSSDRKYNLSAFDAPVSGAGSPGSMSTWKLTIDDTPAGYKQSITGFGAAVTDATVAVINSLPSSQRSALLQSLLTCDGADFSLLRHTIASSDLSADPAYSYDETNGTADVSLKQFALGDRGNAMAALLKEMKQVQPAIKLLGSPWSAPGWMKLNRKLWGTTVNNNLDHTYNTSFAQYFVRYLDAYKAAGVTIDALTIQNEPLNSRNGMPTMYVYADESGQLINNFVGPALHKAGHATQIWAYDHNTDQPGYPTTVLAEAPRYVNTVAWHCYAPNNTWSVLSAFHRAHPTATQYMTECYTSQDTPWYQASAFTLGPLQNYAAGAVAWTLATDTADGPHLTYPDGPCTDCRGLVTVDVHKKTYEFQVDYYMMAQYARFMPRGARVLNGTGSYSYADGSGIQSVATRNPDGTTTVAVENRFGNDVYVTATLRSGRVYSGRVYAQSVTTWVLPQA